MAGLFEKTAQRIGFEAESEDAVSLRVERAKRVSTGGVAEGGRERGVGGVAARIPADGR